VESRQEVDEINGPIIPDERTNRCKKHWQQEDGGGLKDAFNLGQEAAVAT
jgi:hypothetical protein